MARKMWKFKKIFGKFAHLEENHRKNVIFHWKIAQKLTLFHENSGKVVENMHEMRKAFLNISVHEFSTFPGN